MACITEETTTEDPFAVEDDFDFGFSFDDEYGYVNEFTKTFKLYKTFICTLHSRHHPWRMNKISLNLEHSILALTKLFLREHMLIIRSHFAPKWTAVVCSEL